MAINVTNVNEIDHRVRKANECLAKAKRSKPSTLLFDEFWREGELALFFGAAGTGKSVLAVQVADALARGKPLHGFSMPLRWRKVLYVDLRLSETQFLARYGSHKFAENMYRGRPGADDDPFEWIKRAVVADGFRVVVIDDISAIKRTCDGVREPLMLMRHLKRLCRDAGVSILVLSDASIPSDDCEGEADLKRSRVMCSVADSAFSLGRRRMSVDSRLMQTRTTGAEIVWNQRNAPYGSIKQLSSGMLGFEFDERFSERVDDCLRMMIICIDEMREQGKSYRKIEEAYGISRSYAHSLHKKWGPLAKRLREEEAKDRPRLKA
ncbi:MAG TPA: AAA family ATPase [Pyrinomonadaceae bacterium]|nr:AAA family ATPase [Pyrinomonadaceae bacterium]